MAHIRIRDQLGPLQHVYLVAPCGGCELETMIGALHGSAMFTVKRDPTGQAILYPVERGAVDLPDAVAYFAKLAGAEIEASANEAPPPA